MRSANPVLSQNVFRGFARAAGSERMTLDGTVNKTILLLLIVMGAAYYSWGRFLAGNPHLGFLLMTGGLIGGLVFALATSFRQAWSPLTAPLYAVCEGLFLGGISALMNARYPGIAFQAVLLTFGTLFSLLAAYRSGLVRATAQFKLGVAAATGGIMMVYLVSMIMSWFGLHVPFIYQSGLMGIGFSLFVVVIAALNLVLDFDFIEQGAAQGAPRYMEWYGAFALMVTLIWLYVEFLRLLAKLNSRD